MYPDPGRRRRDRIVGPLVAIIWIAAVVLALVALLTPGDRGYTLGFASYGALALYAVAGGWWLISTGRYILRGSSASIRAAIPRSIQKSVRRQLALREPLDLEHADVVLELAHQSRDLIGGQIAFYAFYVPLYLNIAQNSHNPFGLVILAAGTITFIVGVIQLGVANTRLARLTRSHEDDKPTTGRSTTPT